MTAKLATFVGWPDYTSAATQGATTAAWNAFVGAVGQTPTMMLTYADPDHPLSQWVGDARWDASSWQSTPWLTGVTPIIGIPMAITGDGADTDFKAIIAGQWDQALDGMFQAWANAGYTSFMIRPGFEMNGSWVPWAVNPQNAADFTAAFQYIANFAHGFTAASIQVVWSPAEGNYSTGTVPVSLYYPGNSAVDVIGIDTYGEPSDIDSTPSAVSTGPSDFTLQSAIAMALANDKPFALAETGGIDATFPANLASIVAASGVQLSYIGLWDAVAGSTNLTWSQDPIVAAAWKSAVIQLETGGSASPATDTVIVTDTTAGITSAATGVAYTGPVSGIDNEYITTTADSLAITAVTPNSFIYTGAGTDAIDVRAAGGTNVLGGATGSNFLVGGNGFDTFFLDDRALAADVFSTVAGFHSGDNATVWGVTPGDFTLAIYDHQGAIGYTGLDFSFTAPGKPDANIVLAGYTATDLRTGVLNVTYGTTPDLPGLPGSAYMLIHAN